MKTPRGLLAGARIYLSGPMDFVASREEEKTQGWRNRVGQYLRAHGAIVFDPWNKPEVRGLHEYGREDVGTSRTREAWTFESGKRGARARAQITGKYWETLHIDLRMVDTADFTIAFCPTNIYSVGTVHEIALCRQQRKPVLLVSPPVDFPAFGAMREHLKGDRKGLALLAELEREVPIKPNTRGIPSLWYMPLVGGERFFDGFGFDFDRGASRKRFGWEQTALDAREKARPPERPLLPFLAELDRELPKKWDNRLQRFVKDDDWLFWELTPREAGAEIESVKGDGRARPRARS